MVIDTLTWILRAAGFRNVFGFTRANEAIDMLRCLRPDLILTDIHMPDVSGTKLTQLVREFEHLKAIPIVAITADDRQETADRMLTQGADSVLVKPVSEKLLVKHLTGMHSAEF